MSQDVESPELAYMVAALGSLLGAGAVCLELAKGGCYE